MRLYLKTQILLWTLLTISCAQIPVEQLINNHSSTLQHWLDQELSPYLAQQLSQHPRFKGEPIVLVRLDGADIQPDIDALTRSIRDQLMDNLLTVNGVSLPWQPQQQTAQHHRQLDQLQCGRLRDANYYIGIEIKPGINSQYRVSVRALDVKASEWVGGFGKSWTGRLNADEQRALMERRRDESLRGLRILPFNQNHTDLAASYLANNLSCLLRKQELDDLLIYVDPLPAKQPKLRTLLGLIGNNLSRYREVQVTNRKQEADFILRGEAYPIQTGLHQLWVVLHPKNSGKHLSGMDTATWVQLRPEQPTTPFLQTEMTHRIGEKPAGLKTAMPKHEPVTTPIPKPNLKMTPKPQFEKAVYTYQPVTAELNLIYHHSPINFCNHPLVKTQADEGCPILEVSTANTENTHIFVYGTQDGLSRISSGSCQQNKISGLDRPGKQHYRFPKKRFTDSEWSTVYAITVNNHHLTPQFTTLLDQLPDACESSQGMQGNYSGNNDEPQNMTHWLKQIDQLIETNYHHVTWNARRIP